MAYIFGYAKVSAQSQELNRQLDLIIDNYVVNKILTENGKSPGVR